MNAVLLSMFQGGQDHLSSGKGQAALCVHRYGAILAARQTPRRGMAALKVERRIIGGRCSAFSLARKGVRFPWSD